MFIKSVNILNTCRKACYTLNMHKHMGLLLGLVSGIEDKFMV